jgi:hypothetical protein
VAKALSIKADGHDDPEPLLGTFDSTWPPPDGYLLLVAATAALTTGGCPKNAYALPTFSRSEQRPLAHSKPAPKRAFCPSHRLRLASDHQGR